MFGTPLLLALTATVGLTTQGNLIQGQSAQKDTVERPWSLLWHRHFDDAMYSTVGISRVEGLVVAGTYLNPPQHVEAVPLLGDGTALWTHAGNHLMVDASRNGEVLAAIDHDEASSSATIMELRAGSSTPLWTHAVSPCRTLTWQGWASRKPIQVSDDGSTIAVTVNMDIGGGYRGRLYVFHAGDPDPFVQYDLPAPAGNATATAITAQGELVAIVAWPNVYVYDVLAQSLRWSGSLPAGNDALAISGDGTYLAWGWSTFYLREWTGSTYAPLWTHSPGTGTYVGQCAITNDGSAFAVTWNNGNATPNELGLDLYELPSLNLRWSYDYADSRRGAPEDASRASVDIASQMCFSRNGRKLAVASWGGEFPEIHVFDSSVPEPVLIVDTPGSMFDIDIITTPGGLSWAAACGKAVHAGTGGRGGDLYAVRIPEGVWGVHLPGLAPLAPAPAESGSSARDHLTRTEEGVSSGAGG
jgi:hypothetical protein